MNVDNLGSLTCTVKELRELLDKYEDNDEVWFYGYTSDYGDGVAFGVNKETVFEYDW